MTGCVPTRRLLRYCLLALVAPHRALEILHSEQRPVYRTLIPVLLLGGMFFMLFHSRFVVGTWVWQLPYAPLILAQYALASVWNWLIGGFALLYTFRWFGTSQPSQGRVDLAITLLWFTWIVMPPFDVVHLWGLPTTLLIDRLPWAPFFIGHASSLVMAPIRAIQLYLILRQLGGIARWRAAGLCLALPIAARFLIEPLGGLFFLWSDALGYQINLWVGQHLMLFSAILWSLWWRLTLERRPVPHRATWVTATAVALLILTSIVWNASLAWAIPGARPMPPELAQDAITQPPAHEIAPGRRVWRWDPGRDTARGSAPYTLGPMLDGVTHHQVVSLPLGQGADALPQSIQRVTCEIDVIARGGLQHDGLPQVACSVLRPMVTIPSRTRQASSPGMSGTQRVQQTWDAASPEWTPLLEHLGTDQAQIYLSLMVHGGGDYTPADVVQIRRVQLIVEGAS